MTKSRNTPLGQVALLERPLSARSLVASLLLGMRPPRLSGARLVRWCTLFGIAEGTARVALHRMVAAGELSAADGTYELAGRVRARQRPQDWSLTPRLAGWTGEWSLAVVAADARPAPERVALRDAMRRLRYAELREGVWTRPANLPRAAAPEESWAIAGAQCTWWSGRPADDDRELAQRLFAPTEWAQRAELLAARLRDETIALGPDRLADAFVAGAATLAHVRADPLLPPELCGRGWPGPRLRRAYGDYQRSFAIAVRDWFRSTDGRA